MQNLTCKASLAFIVCSTLVYAENSSEQIITCTSSDDASVIDQLETRSITKQNVGRPTTIQNNLHVKGNLVIDGDIIAAEGKDISIHGGDLIIPPASTIRTAHISPVMTNKNGACVEDPQGIVHFNASVGIQPTEKLLVNTISPVQTNEDGTYRENQQGTLALNGPVTITAPHALEVNTINPLRNASDATINCQGNVAIKQGNTLFANTIKPTSNTPHATTTIQGNLCVSNKQLFGQTEPIRLLDQTTLPVLGIVFKSNDPATIGRGAFIDCQLHGVATVTDSNQSQTLCDVVILFSVYVGPGSFENQIITKPRLLVGKPMRNIATTNIDLSFETHNDTTVLMQIKCLNTQKDFTINAIDGVLFYKLTSANFEHLFVPKIL